MTVFAIDPNDSGAIQLHPDIVDTARMDIGEGTRRLHPPVLRRPFANTGSHNTGEQPLFPIGAELAVWGKQWGAHAVTPFQEPGQPRPPQPLPPPPAPGKVVDHLPPPGNPQPGGGEPPPPSPPPPAWNEPAAEHPVVTREADDANEVVKKLFRRGTHRHPRRPVDWKDMAGTLTLAAAGGYVGASAAQMWQVPW